MRVFVHPNGRKRIQFEQHVTLELQDGHWRILPVAVAVKPLKRGRRR